MSYTKFYPIVRRWGRSSFRLPQVSRDLPFRQCNYTRRSGPYRERTERSVYTVTPLSPAERATRVYYRPHIMTLRRIFGRLDDLHDLAPQRKFAKVAAIYRKWCVKMWGVRTSGRYLKWTLSEVI